MQKLWFPISLVAALAAGAHVALSQDKVDGQTTQELKKQETVPPATGRNLPEQNAAQEPSSKVPHDTPAPGVFAKGVLTVPGAQVDVDTAPAKFSARTDADDKVPIAGYRLKELSQEQRREIVQGLEQQRDAGSTEASEAHATIGAEIPSTVALQGLTAMPDALTAKFAGLRGTAFMRAGGKVLIVDLDNSLVVGVL